MQRRLQHDPEVAVPEAPQRLEDLERHLGVRRVLHVDPHEEPVRRRRLEDPSQVVDRVTRSRSSPSCVSFSEMLRPTPALTTSSMTFEVFARRLVGGCGAGDAFAEVVERLRQAACLHRARRGNRFGGRFTGDEASREAGGRGEAVPRGQPLQAAAARQQVKEGLRRRVDHQCALSGGTGRRCSIVLA